MEIAGTLGFESTLGAGIAIVLAFFLLLCLVVGVAVQTQLGSWSFEKLDRINLNRLASTNHNALQHITQVDSVTWPARIVVNNR